MRSERRKGSRDNVTLWNDELRATWAWLANYRAKVMEAHKAPVQLKPERRQLLVSQSGTPLRKSFLDSAWQRMTPMALKEKVIDAETRFGLHGLKHRGITNTAGNQANKQDAAGHANPETTNRYAHDLPLVPPPTRK